MSDIRERIADVLFTETARIVFADTDDELTKRVAAVMSMSAGQLADVLLSKFDIRERITVDTSKDFELPWA
jgi:hypothetical protein